MEPPEAAARTAELAEVSDHWLRAKQVIERQFSIGYFDPPYVARFRCAVVEENNDSRRILSFATLLEGPRRGELSGDLVRYRPDGPTGMDFLITPILLWVNEAGDRRFNAGIGQ